MDTWFASSSKFGVLLAQGKGGYIYLLHLKTSFWFYVLLMYLFVCMFQVLKWWCGMGNTSYWRLQTCGQIWLVLILQNCPIWVIADGKKSCWSDEDFVLTCSLAPSVPSGTWPLGCNHCFAEVKGWTSIRKKVEASQHHDHKENLSLGFRRYKSPSAAWFKRTKFWSKFLYFEWLSFSGSCCTIEIWL